ncbi:MAG: hypothetical protein ACTHKB_09375 [Burkholderiaceae bacterium]
METNNPALNGNGHAADVNEKVNQASSGAHQAVDKMTAAARPAVDKIASGAHQAVDKIAGAASQAADSLGAKSEQWKDTQERMMDEARVYIRNKPGTAIGIAVAAGFLLSKIFSSR